MQAVALLGGIPELAARLERVRYQSCWAVMLDYAEPPRTAAGNDASVLALARHASQFPERASGHRWVLHATSAWSAANLDRDATAVAVELVAAFSASTPIHATAHRWRYARVEQALGAPFLAAIEAPVMTCGDYCLGDDVAAALASGRAAAEALAGQLL